MKFQSFIIQLNADWNSCVNEYLKLPTIKYLQTRQNLTDLTPQCHPENQSTK